MDAGTMVDQVYLNSGLRKDDPLVTKEFVLNALNNAQTNLANEADWPWLTVVTTFATVVGQDLYAPPDGWVATTEIIDPDGDPLTRADSTQLDQDWLLGSGAPRQYAINADQIKLRPIPDTVATFTHEYITTPTDFVSDADTSIFPTQHHAAIVAYATADSLNLAGKSDIGALWGQRATAAVAAMRRAVRRDRGPQRARIRTGNWI